MIKRTLERAARARLSLPIVITLGAIAMVVNEGTFQHTTRVLRRGIALTDVRIQAAQALQSITLMEAASRGLLAHDNEADRQRFDKASQALATSINSALDLIKEIDPQGEIAVDQVRQRAESEALRFRRWKEQAGSMPSGSAQPGSLEVQAGNAALLAEFENTLSKAAGLQAQARLSIYDALMVSRVAVHALVMLSVLTLILFARELRRSHAARERESERLAALIEARTLELRELADHLVTVREDERGRLARELHDEMGGLLTTMKLELARLRRMQALPAAALERMASIDQRVNDGIAFKRRVVENLRPSSLDQLGLKVAIELLCADSATMIGIPVQARIADISLGTDEDLTLFRVVQESLTNIAKYAGAKAVTVELGSTDGVATLRVADDGVGFDTTRTTMGRHGLLGMQVRLESHNGTFKVLSSRGRGTQIVATLPESPGTARRRQHA